MGQQDAFALGRSNLNGFLFADIGVEGSGMPLTVISALARQGLDPWQEAGRLASLPRQSATEGLARLIATMPASLWPMRDATAVAARLVALLPGFDDRDVISTAVLSALRPPTAAVWPTERWLIMAVLTIALLAALAVFVAPELTRPPAALPASVAAVNSVPTGD